MKCMNKMVKCFSKSKVSQYHNYNRDTSSQVNVFYSCFLCDFTWQLHFFLRLTKITDLNISL